MKTFVYLFVSALAINIPAQAQNGLAAQSQKTVLPADFQADPTGISLPDDVPEWKVRTRDLNSDMWKAEMEVMKKYGVRAVKAETPTELSASELFTLNKEVFLEIKSRNPSLTREQLAKEKMVYAKTQNRIEHKMRKYFQKTLGYQPVECDVDWLPLDESQTNYNVKVYNCNKEGKRDKMVCNVNINTTQNVLLADLMK